MKLFTALLFLLLAFGTQARTLDEILMPEAVTERVYYFKGSLDARTYDNMAFNNNIGFVITDEGVVLIDSGAAAMVGAQVAQAVARITDQPIRWVINTGSQDHRWLGNGYFAERGAEVIALRRTVETQQRFADEHAQRIAGILKERFEGTKPVTAPAPIDSDHHRLTIGGVAIEMIYAGGAHFPGDIMVWLPQESVVFSGDIVYVDRLLGIHPFSDIHGLQQAFQALEALQPKYIVPGHGRLSDLAKARAETGDYYDFLINEVAAAVADWVDLGETVERLADAPQFEHLTHFDSWHRTNINRVYLQLE